MSSCMIAPTFALGVAHAVAWAQGLRQCRGDPGGLYKGHLDLQARAGPNEAHLTPTPSQHGQRGEAPLQQARHELHQRSMETSKGSTPSWAASCTCRP